MQLVAFLGARGEHDDGGLAGGTARTQSASVINPRHARQHPVQHDQVGFFQRDQRLGGVGVRGFGNPVTGMAQIHGNQLANGGFIFYDQNTFVHSIVIKLRRSVEYDDCLTIA